MTPAAASAMILSMTGYAQARVERDGWLLRVAVRSVNHRFLDLRVRIPEGFEALESRVRQLVRETLRRGHVEVTLHIESAGVSGVQINREAAASYLRTVEALRNEFGFEQEPDLVALLRLPGVVSQNGGAGPLDEDATERLNELCGGCVAEALQKLNTMRQAEGWSLAVEMNRLLADIAEKTKQAEVLTELSRPAYALRLQTRLADLLGGVALDPARLAQEAALLAERADVTEELARLRSHIEQFGKTVAVGGEIGKKLDFLLQEMQREANTFLSKTPGLGDEGLAMTGLGLQIKSEIEKLREQAQNVE